MEIVEEIPVVEGELIPLNRVRVETALSRFPIHRLAKRDQVEIDLQQTGENGDPSFKWEVTYNQKHGQPGPLAYKVDTLIVNRRIDEAGRPIPGVIKLGSLTELCSSLGIADSGENRSNLKKALHQNASAYITAKIRYRTKTGKEKWGEIGYTRYSVVFTGEMLPDGSLADSVYIIPNPSFRDLLNQVEVRPLDYDYLTALAPGSQRFYELLSFQMYGAVAGNRPRAKMRYSDYCKHAPQTRYFDFDRVKKQMFKIHAPHREAGYIAKIEYETTIDAEGAADWEMFYTPGPKAIAEFETFTRRQVRLTDTSSVVGSATGQGTAAPASDPLRAEFTRRGVAEKKARELLANLKPGQEVLDQLEYVDQIVQQATRRRIENPPGLYVMYVRDNITPPDSFVGSRKQKLLEQTKQQKKADEAKAAQLRLDYEAFVAQETTRFIERELPGDKYQEIFEQNRRENRAMLPHLSAEELDELTVGTVRSQIRQELLPRLPTLAQFTESTKNSLLPA